MRRVIYFLLLLTFAAEGFAGIYPVSNTNDGGIGSFRDALNFANLNPGRDTIFFGLPGSGPFVIQPLSPYPPLTDQAGVFIDGFSQPGAFAGAAPPYTAKLLIGLDGSIAGFCNGLEIISSGNTVQGLVICKFSMDGIRIVAHMPPTAGNVIFCNFIGTDFSGAMAKPNGSPGVTPYAGVYIRPSAQCTGIANDNIIDANLISANLGDGVAISSCPPNTDVFLNQITRNVIGADISGMQPLGNHHAGVYLGEGTHDNLVAHNLVCDNDYEGVSIIGYYQQGGPAWSTRLNHVVNNSIGLAADGSSPLGNARDGLGIGVWGPQWKLGYADHNDAKGNTIAFNSMNGILVWENPVNAANADFNQFSQNSIYANALHGIDLNGEGVTLNDPGDSDAEANEEINFPVITSAILAEGSAAVSGTLDIGAVPVLCTVEVFLAESFPAYPGYGQGKTWLGSVNPDAAGNWSINLIGLSAGDSICATATDAAFNTSEFSANVGVTQASFVMEAGQPETWKLSPTIPNPFQDVAAWELSLRESAWVSLRILDLNGKELAHLYNGRLAAGRHEFVWNAEVAPGLYFLEVRGEGWGGVRKVVKR